MNVAPVSVCQLSLVAMRAPEELYTLRTGSARTPETPKALSDGPSARSTTVLGSDPATIKPLIRTLSPVETVPRVERFCSRGPIAGSFVVLLVALEKGCFDRYQTPEYSDRK